MEQYMYKRAQNRNVKMKNMIKFVVGNCVQVKTLTHCQKCTKRDKKEFVEPKNDKRGKKTCWRT